MDKSWMSKDRRSNEYQAGVESFINFALENGSDPNSIRCPCMKCGYGKFLTTRGIRDHLICDGIDKSYVVWYFHGENFVDEDAYIPKAKRGKSDCHGFLDNAVEMVEAVNEDFNSSPDKFEQLLEDAQKPMYPGCVKFSKLATLVRLYNIKASGGWPDKSFSDLLAFLKEFLPALNHMPSSLYEAKKTLGALGMEYEKIHACPNDCILYRKEHEDAIACPTCGLSRWKINTNSTDTKKKNVPAKVLWYFPPIPRFRRMFRNKKTAENLLWHARSRQKDGKLRHPADSPSWKLVDHMWPEFGDDPRNLRLTLAADGINPFGNLSSRYSCWPVILATYNLPPWLCMKRKFLMLTMLISGPKQPGNDIDVYLAPLIDDLKSLWEVGVQVYDAYREEVFMLKAVLLWTINDFPAYGNLSGCTVKGYFACPICGENTHGRWLKHGKKMCFDRSRRFLPKNDELRHQVEEFYGEPEYGTVPEPLTGEEVLRKVEGITVSWGKKVSKKREKAEVKVKLGKRKDRNVKKVQVKRTIKKPSIDDPCWKKKSIFFDLPYWSSLFVRHCLDVMHVEKNALESLIGTLLEIPGKSKDGLASRKDLVERGVRLDLAPKPGKVKVKLPAAPYSLSKKEKQSICDVLSKAKFPAGYCSNFKKLVSMQDLKLYGLKSHDCHVLMQQLLIVAIRAVLPDHVRYTITRFCLFFNALCCKTIDVPKLSKMEDEIVVTLCLLEKIFPPSFFDIMIHLTVHLIREVRLCGPVFLRWMYPFERYMKFLKDYVRNRNCPEGCMAECYIAEEAIEFCSDFLSEVHSVGLPSNSIYERKDVEKALGAGRLIKVDPKLLRQAHHCVLQNTVEVIPYINQHMEQLKIEHPKKSKSEKWLQDEHNRTFAIWFKERIDQELENPEYIVSETLEWLAHGPRAEVKAFAGYSVNGCDYRTKSYDDEHVGQDSGVSLVAETMQISSSKDKNPKKEDMTFYGVIKEIWEINFNMFTQFIFKCDWVKSTNGMRVEDFEIELVNLSCVGHKSDTFVLASHVKKVFYINDPKNEGWSVVLKTPNMDWLNEEMFDDITEDDHQCYTRAMPAVDTLNVVPGNVYVRGDCKGTWVAYEKEEEEEEEKEKEKDLV